ncbi:uncharacterized protein MKZ38_007728 [Zalerion maritima]|uniref:Uncharacterized protein n=1 Tax=Zalerion maritima TaxID=339359 RepID=A0AAD5RM19_9PEZI|nr:uncharacterized protein MKZ38_007728 [Zalerion maritima]
MGATSAFDELINTGSWTTSQAKDTSTNGSRAPSANRDADPRPRIPRSFATPKTGNRRYPPPPSVEEESDSIAREYGSGVSESSDGPKYIGDVNQNPVILEVPENNPERRFVLVTEPEKHAPEHVDASKPAVPNGKKPEKSDGTGAGSTASSTSSPSAPRDRPRETPRTSPIKERDARNHKNSREPQEQKEPKGPREANSTSKTTARDLRERERQRQREDERNEWDRRKSRDANELGRGKERKSEPPLPEIKPGIPPTTTSIPEWKPAAKKASASSERRPEPTILPNRRAADRTRQDDVPIPRKKDRAKSDYEANTCRRYVLVPGSGDEKKPVSPTRQRLKERKSRQDLPRIETKDLDRDYETSRPSRHRRSLSATEIKQEPSHYFESRQEPLRNDDFLSPTVVRKHSTRRRHDERYYDDTRGGETPSRRDKSYNEVRSTPLERKDLSKVGRERDAQSSSPVAPRRTPSSAKLARRASRRGGFPDGYRGSGRAFDRDDSLPRHPDRTATIPAYVGAAVAAREVVPVRSRSRRNRRESPPSDAVASSSEEESRVPYPRSPPQGPRKSFVDYPDERGFLLMPPGPQDEVLVSPKKIRPSPLPSPRVSSSSFNDVDEHSLRGASTYPGAIEPQYSGHERPPSIRGRDPSPPRRGYDPDNDVYLNGRPKSRGPGPNIMNASAPLIANPSLEGRPRSPIVDPYRRSAPLLTRWKQPNFAVPDGKALTYRRFLCGVQDGNFEGLPACPRRIPVAGYQGWLTLPRCNDFTICPSCYEYVFENTEYGSAFIPLPFRAANIETACSFGCSYWYQIAWFLTLKYTQPDLRILMSLADIVAGNPPCPTSQVSRQKWYSIRDPYDGKLIPSFSLCGTCVKVVGALLPSLAKYFEPLHSRSTEGSCVLQCDATSKDNNFLEFFDAMEKVADVSMMNRIPPDMQELTDRVLSICTVAKCPKDVQIRDGCWYFMRSIKDLTVCKECFNSVVTPWIEKGNPVAGDFHAKPNHVPLATCQLYSRRMQDVFSKACERKGLGYLDGKVQERKLMEGEIKTKIQLLLSKPIHYSYEEDELNRLTVEWAEWE